MNTETSAFCKACKQKLKAMLFQTEPKFSHVMYMSGFPYLLLRSHMLTPNILSNREIKCWLSHIAQKTEPQHDETPTKRHRATWKSATSPIFITVVPVLQNCILSLAYTYVYYFISKSHKGPTPIKQPRLQLLYLVHKHEIALMVPFQSLMIANYSQQPHSWN